jgi:hypothetical protein
MTKDQLKGQFRAVLLALGTMLATLGFSDGNNWMPVVGIILAGWSLTWGLLHHKDPANPGTLSWSLLRKFVNAIGSAALAYGYKHPEQINAIMAFVAALGPLAAAHFSWISNKPDDEETDQGPDGMSIPIIAIGFICFFLLPSCADYPIKARIITDYGTISADAKGGIVIEPNAKPIVIPIHASK